VFSGYRYSQLLKDGCISGRREFSLLMNMTKINNQCDKAIFRVFRVTMRKKAKFEVFRVPPTDFRVCRVFRVSGYHIHLRDRYIFK